MKKPQTIIFMPNKHSKQNANQDMHRYDTFLDKALFSVNKYAKIKHVDIVPPKPSIRIKYEWVNDANINMNAWLDEMLESILCERDYH
jgi:hypothetical protein